MDTCRLCDMLLRKRDQQKTSSFARAAGENRGGRPIGVVSTACSAASLVAIAARLERSACATLATSCRTGPPNPLKITDRKATAISAMHLAALMAWPKTWECAMLAGYWTAGPTIRRRSAVNAEVGSVGRGRRARKGCAKSVLKNRYHTNLNHCQ